MKSISPLELGGISEFVGDAGASVGEISDKLSSTIGAQAEMNKDKARRGISFVFIRSLDGVIL